MRQLPDIIDPNVLVGPETSDDAAVYKLNDELALVCTSDFFSPMVDDAYVFGQIAASNALSDVYAMGAKPLFALNMLGYPSAKLPQDQLLKMLQGGASKAKEAGIAIIGGHTVDNPELKYGLAVVGTINPNEVWTNSGVKPGDVLLLTKPIGTGIITTALKKQECPSKVAEKAIETMRELNKKAAEIASKVGNIHACTDVTGFGLLGHLYEMAEGSALEINIEFSKVPIIEGTKELIRKGFVPGGTRRNLDYLQGKISYEHGLSEDDLSLLADAQTSGGLIFSLSPEDALELKRLLLAANITVTEIGRAFKGEPGRININL
ncbi:selenide, water dikinase SelD [Vulcanibacillus modesticaldus]|uniref:Selenide, water dikinase n=1 Tax=Vulcanibacillus modesticaldus TaxID=337097 RepID=A0A1D2YUU4_9BACI|nr:selenide, water dikinase SelD [Vulcanibacillus modesticaldus]